MAQSPPLVPPLLALAVLADPIRMIFAVTSGVVGVVGPPLLLALSADLVIERIGLDFLLMIILAAAPLTFRLAADALLRTENGGKKSLGAIRPTVLHPNPSVLRWNRHCGTTPST